MLLSVAGHFEEDGVPLDDVELFAVVGSDGLHDHIDPEGIASFLAEGFILDNLNIDLIQKTLEMPGGEICSSCKARTADPEDIS